MKYKKAENNVLLVREPNGIQIHLYQLKASKIECNEHVVLAPFRGIPKHFCVASKKAVSETDLSTMQFSLPSAAVAQQITLRQNHVKLVSDAVTALQHGHMKKVVLSRQKWVNGSFSPTELFLKLAKKYPNACVFMFNSSETGCWMGATPERLLLVDNGKATAASLAGTRPSGVKEPWGDKEKEEQRFVTEDIKYLFGDSGLVDVNESELKTKSAGKIEHLFTEVSGQMPDGLSPSALAAKLHPTPAVGGLPRKMAVDYILNNEAFNRGFYSGYFGIESQQTSAYYVNLRSMQLFKNGLVLYAGGGITAASDPEAEWEETERKLRTLLDVIEDQNIS